MCDQKAGERQGIYSPAPPVAAPLTLQPQLLPGGPCPWLLVTGWETPPPPLTSASGQAYGPISALGHPLLLAP